MVGDKEPILSSLFQLCAKTFINHYCMLPYSFPLNYRFPKKKKKHAHTHKHIYPN